MLNRRLHLEGRIGEPVLPWWRRVLTWLRSLQVITGPNVLAIPTPDGLRVTVRTENPVTLFFEVSVSGTIASILPGTVEGHSPVLHPDIRRDGDPAIRLDGTLPDGTTSTNGAPGIDLSDAKPGPDSRSALCVVATLEPESGQLPEDLEKNPEALVIDHISDITPAAQRAAARAGRPFRPLAIIYWREGAIQRAEQLVAHNQVIYKITADSSLPDDRDSYHFASA